MKYLHLIWAALFRRKVRTIITLLSILVAFLLFGLLDSVRSAFDNAGQNIEGIDRLVTTSKISPFAVPLPKSLLADIQSIPGVTAVSYGNSVGGTYQDPKNFIPVEALSDNYFDFYPEWQISPAEHQALRKTRTGAVAEESIAQKYHWKVGDKIPVQHCVDQKDGSTTWTFDLVGIFRLTDPNRMDDERALHINWDYFDEARQADHGTVGWYIVKVADPDQVDRVSQTIDALSANSDHETKTQSENLFAAALVGQLGDIGLIAGSIMGAVFFTLILLTGNTMAQAVRERIPELATLKTVGFTPCSVMGLVLGESVLLLLLGSAIGLAISAVAVVGVSSTLGRVLPLPMSPVGGSIWLSGLTLAVIIGFTVGMPPALRGMRLRIVDALSGR